MDEAQAESLKPQKDHDAVTAKVQGEPIQGQGGVLQLLSLVKFVLTHLHRASWPWSSLNAEAMTHMIACRIVSLDAAILFTCVTRRFVACHIHGPVGGVRGLGPHISTSLL